MTTPLRKPTPEELADPSRIGTSVVVPYESGKTGGGSPPANLEDYPTIAEMAPDKTKISFSDTDAALIFEAFRTATIPMRYVPAMAGIVSRIGSFLTARGG